MKRKSVCLIYLGRMGAGSKITFILGKQLVEMGANVRIILSSNSIDLKSFEELQIPIHLVSMFEHRALAFIPFKPSVIKEIVKFIPEDGLVYFPMPHPRDNQIIRSLLKKGLPAGRAIHDFARHPGDIWPNKLSPILQKRYSSFLIAHSHFVANKLSNRKVTVVPLPSLAQSVCYQPIRGFVVFIGRLRRYKGLELLINAWGEVSAKDESFSLTIAGSGKLKRNKSNQSISLQQKWLSEDEISELIARANCLVFPYIEASQSGLLPVIDSLKIPLVVTNVGGLTEQVSSQSSLIVEPNPLALSRAILETIDGWKPIKSIRTARDEVKLARLLLEKLESKKTKT